MRISILCGGFLGNITLLLVTGVNGQDPERPNVLFIAVDDLKPELGCYGNDLIKTPNFDRLAQQSTVFHRNYCQQAVSGPTRASLMTGKRPDYTKVWDLKTRMRDVNPDILSIPQYFASQGYETSGIGKIYDFRCIDEFFDKPSWTIPFYRDISEKYFSKKYGRPVLYYYQDPVTKQRANILLEEANKDGLTGHDAIEYAWKELRFSVEAVDADDNAFKDGAATMQAMDAIKDLAEKEKPFFFALGFERPHLPFAVPEKYWDMYERDSMPLAVFQKHAKNSPELAYHNSGELRAYSDIPPLIEFNDQEYGIGLPVEKQKELIHGYYASVSYVDAQLGLVLDLLDSLGITENTIIVLWGDHGWHLGDHDLWCKHTNFEQATRAPLIISAPGYPANTTDSPTEFVDIFPTLCELAGLEIPQSLDGKSLLPVMKNGNEKVKNFAVSQYPRGKDMMGYTLRTERYRYVLWMKNNYRSYMPFDDDLVVTKELYDYQTDPLETVNLIEDPEYDEVSSDLEGQMIGFLRSQEKK